MRSTALSLVGPENLCALLKCCNSEVLPVQEVVFVKVSDTSSNFTGHPLQLQQLSVSEHPILLRQIAPQIPLQTHTQTNAQMYQYQTQTPDKLTRICICLYYDNRWNLTSGSCWTAMCGGRHTAAVDSPVTVSSALLTADV